MDGKNNLPEVLKNLTIALFEENGTKNAVALRREMVQLPIIANALNQVEKHVFAASTKIQIREISDDDMVRKTAQMFKYIAMDIGVIIPQDQTEWAYICTRLMNLLQRYYNQLTLADVKLAFELATVGELDEFLPKDRNGRPDKNHYQQFNIEFLAKILNAYRQKQNRVVVKAFAALPEPKFEMSPERVKEGHNSTMEKLALCFLEYKYTSRLPQIASVYEMLFFDHLLKIGLADQLNITIADKRIAFDRLQKQGIAGKLNEFEFYHINKQGLKHETVESKAYWIARHKEFIATFDRMIKEEIYIFDHIKFIE